MIPVGVSGVGSYPRYATRNRPARRYTNANPQQVGRPASKIRAFAMIKLTLTLNLSYKQLRSILTLLMLLFS